MVVPKKKKTFKKKVAVKPKKLVTKKAVVKKSRPKKTSVKKKTPLDLKRSLQNPIIQPTEHAWESKATFNPTAFQHDGKIHIIYRAIGDTDNSVLGYAESRNGSTIQESFPRPVYYHFISRNKDKSIPAISYSSGGGWGGGCEDPRITLLGDKVYMLYTAFDGWGSVRIALTSISLNDFLDKCWNWKEPVLISPPGEIHKNWVLFPEKIKGKYAILHSLSPHIMIDYFKSLEELDGSKFIESVHQGHPLWMKRDMLVRGVGPTPIKTKYGWLVLYHAMENANPNQYKLWAMMLDLDNPEKILYRSIQPILEPDSAYENYGFKAGVVCSCGAVVKDGKLFVYYGGADTVSCVATADLDKFLKELVSAKHSTLTEERIMMRA